MCLGIPGRIEEISRTDALMPEGRVSFGGSIKQVNLAYVPEAVVGDYVIVHVGFAISIIKEQEALRVYKTLEEIGALEP